MNLTATQSQYTGTGELVAAVQTSRNEVELIVRAFQQAGYDLHRIAKNNHDGAESLTLYFVKQKGYVCFIAIISRLETPHIFIFFVSTDIDGVTFQT
jgi:hypothetical protein